MKLFPDKSLGFRLLSAYILIIVIVLSAYTLFAIVREERKVRKELTEKGEMLVNLLASGSRIGVFAENKDLLKDVATGITAEPDVVLVGIYNADLKPLYEMNRSSMRKDVYPDIERKVAVIKTGLDGATLRETGHTLEFTKPVILHLFQNEEKTIYFDEKGADTNVRTIGHVKIVLGKEALNRQILGILLRNAIIALIFIGASIAVVYLRVRKITKPLETLTKHVKALGQGDAVAQVPVETMDEVGRLAAAFNTMLDERKSAQQAFQKILMDIHDGIGGITTNICLLSEVAQKASTPTDVNKALSTILDLSREGMVEIRSLMYSLDRNDLNWRTLAAELRNRGMKTVEHHTIAFEMKAEVEENVISPASLLCLHLFRIYREALTNVIKHSKAKNVTVGFRVNKERIVLTIQDDGQGFDYASRSNKGRGVPNMKARAAEIGGTVTVISNAGTCVTIEIPLPVQARPSGN